MLPTSEPSEGLPELLGYNAYLAKIVPAVGLTPGDGERYGGLSGLRVQQSNLDELDLLQMGRDLMKVKAG